MKDSQTDEGEGALLRLIIEATLIGILVWERDKDIGRVKVV